jgi:Tc5 transposase DNA-binding domain.
MLSTWIGDQNQCYVLVSVLLNHAKAVSINEDLSRSDDNVKPFNTSTGWFSRFPKRYNFHNIKMTGAATFADTLTLIHYIG